MGALFFMVWIAVAVFIAAKAYEHKQKANAAWTLAAVELGLVSVPPGWTERRSMRGWIDGVSVEIKEKAANKATHTVYEVRLLAPTPTDLKLSAEDFLAQVSAHIRRDDLQVGDESFDAAVYVRGDEGEMLARLTPPARRALKTLIERGAKLESGKLELELKTQVTDAHELTGTMRALAAAARLFHLNGVSVPEALAHNAASDPEARVRLRNLSVLLRDHPRTELARQAAAKALKDPEPAVRLRAAEFLPGTAASPVLQALVRSSAETWVRAEALRVLARTCAYEEISDTVALALGAPEVELRQEAVRAITRGRAHAKVDALAEMANDPPLELVEALVEAFEQLGGPRAEEALLRLLAHESNWVRALAAKALGTTGTVRAVEPLLPLTRGLMGGDLQEAARDAVRQIQGRLGDVEAGALAVVDDQGGALSLPVQEGAVSVVENAAVVDPGTRNRSS
jgi:HEAT repeat protein